MHVKSLLIGFQSNQTILFSFIQAMANISGQFLTFSLLVPFVQLTGQQRTSGYVSFVPVDTGGNLQLNVTDVAITGNASLKNSPRSLHVGAIHAQLEVSTL